jgi:hypothetical protein
MLKSLNHKTVIVGFTAIHLEIWKFKNLGIKEFRILKYLCPVLPSEGKILQCIFCPLGDRSLNVKRTVTKLIR